MPRASSQSSTRNRDSGRCATKKVSAEAIAATIKAVVSFTQNTGRPSTRSRIVPPPMAVTVPKNTKAMMSICLREATSAPETAKATRPTQPAMARMSEIMPELWHDSGPLAG